MTRLVDAAATRWIVAVLALVFTAWVVMAGLSGPQDPKNAARSVLGAALADASWIICRGLSRGAGDHATQAGCRERPRPPGPD